MGSLWKLWNGKLNGFCSKRNDFNANRNLSPSEYLRIWSTLAKAGSNGTVATCKLLCSNTQRQHKDSQNGRSFWWRQRSHFWPCRGFAFCVVTLSSWLLRKITSAVMLRGQERHVRSKHCRNVFLATVLWVVRSLPARYEHEGNAFKFCWGFG